MANPANPIHADDIHYQHRGGDCFTLFDPTLPEGQRDVASTWCERDTRREVWRWRMERRTYDGTPYPTATNRDSALEAMLAEYAADPAVAARVEAQRPRWSFGALQIVRTVPAA